MTAYPITQGDHLDTFLRSLADLLRPHLVAVQKTRTEVAVPIPAAPAPKKRGRPRKITTSTTVDSVTTITTKNKEQSTRTYRPVLSPREVGMVRALAEKGLRHTEIEDATGIPRRTISRVVCGQAGYRETRINARQV